MEPSTLVNLIAQFGFPIALCIALLWFVRHMIAEWRSEHARREEESKERERRLGERLDLVEDNHRTRLAEMVEVQTKVITQNTTALRESNAILRTFCDVVQTRPCLVPAPDEPYVRRASQPTLPDPPKPHPPGSDGYPAQ